ncbi:hypothetical protein MNEG_16611 [Monoraphidium neglectum]|uniref:Peptidase A1 domain-containing protein n=1 Tax=Monoraphidium neglectum TaxID=145388 RepID=A0A0D2K5B5_9CHLO|nr:hypothetical protein MNEG_16611 [Monoraphidium neglectum]KIY91353.1 hypothetical protein MNEG_16611 [Monoraphidium neglectum]|eukprot:XP_013890373.1 hypothetical protein MNEG_16611 [Monoraphidium neglectum]
MDSGTTFNYLPTLAFEALVVMLEGLLMEKGLNYKTLNPDSESPDICWDLPTLGSTPADAWAAAAEAFPTLRLRFDGAALLLPAQRYLFADGGDRGGGRRRFCLGFFDNARAPS